MATPTTPVAPPVSRSVQVRLPRLSLRVAFRCGAVAVAAAIASLAVLGVLAVEHPVRFRHFDLDGEFTVPAAFSAALLGGCALASAMQARKGPGGRSLWFLVALFSWMALDEAFSFHERLEVALGIDWQVLYLPLVLAGAVSFLLVARRMVRHRSRLAVWLCGAVAWTVAQALEFAEWDALDHPRPGYAVMMVFEEVLEMSGSALWFGALVAGLLALTRD